MFEIDKIPSAIYSVLAEKGVSEEELRLAAYCDRDREHTPCDTYLFATKDALLLLCGTLSGETDTDTHRYHKVWKEKEYTVYPLSELARFRMEELISGNRFTAERTDGTPVFITAMTNFCRSSMLIFKKYLEKLKRSGDFAVEANDDPKSFRCPKCGNRYPEKNRKICPRCMEKGKLFRRISVFFLKYKHYLAFSLLSLVGMTAASILGSYFSSGFFYREVLDEKGKYFGLVVFALALIIGTKLLNLGVTIVNNYMTSVIAAKVNLDLKKTIFSAIERLSLGFFTSRQTGGLMTQVNDDSNTIYDFFCNTLPYFLVNIVKVAVLVVLLFLIDPLLSVISLAVVPVSFLLMRINYNKNRKFHAERHSARRSMNSFLSDELTGMRVVKAFSKEKEEIGRFNKRSSRLGDADMRRGVFNTFFSPLSGFLLYAFGNLVALGVGGWFVTRGKIDYASLMMFTTYMNMIYGPLHFFNEMSEMTADCSNSLQRLFEIMDSQPEVEEAKDPVHIDTFRGDIRFDGVSFSYIKNRKIIDQVSFSVGAGETLGIVGHTGAGKSTLANLLIRLYDPESGSITIDGIDIRKVAFADLYRNIAIVSQETYLFMGTILDNIRYARPDAGYDEVIAAAKAAGAHDFIIKLPDAYDTKIGFGYQELSGGERQRLSIARAILRDPKILILDEATAAMDTETERKIQTALTELIKGKTTIMIAHRLSTLRDATSLIVIERGKVAEAGTHDELLAAEGVYHRLYSLQLEALQNAGIA